MSRLLVLVLLLATLVGCNLAPRPMVHLAIDATAVADQANAQLRITPDLDGAAPSGGVTLFSLSPLVEEETTHARIARISLRLPPRARGRLRILAEVLLDDCLIARGSADAVINGDGLHPVPLSLTRRPLPECPDILIVKTGDGRGRVVSQPAGVDCGTTCRNRFAVGERITLRAEPEQGSYFAGWSMACSGSELCLIQSGAFNSPVHAQFERAFPCTPQGFCWENPLPHGVSLQDLWATSQDAIYAVGSSGTLLRHDGATWRGVASGTSENLWGIGGSGPDDITVVGDAGTILHFDGNTWRRSAGPMAGIGALRAVWASRRGEHYVVGDGGVMLRGDGRTFAPVSTTSEMGSCDLWSIWGDRPDNIHVAGDSGGDVEAFHYDGRSWVKAGISGIPFHLGERFRVWGGSWGDVYLTTYFEVFRWEKQRKYWRTFGYGDGWTGMSAMWGTAPDQIFLGGSSGLALFDGKAVHARLKLPDRIYALAGRGADRVFAVGETGTMRLWDGQNWNDLRSRAIASLPRAIFGFGPNDVFAWSADGPLHFNGQTWTLEQRLVSYVGVLPEFEGLPPGLGTQRVEISAG